MGIKQKFFALSGLVGVILALVSIMGYYKSQEAIQQGVEREITAAITDEQDKMDGWLMEKAMAAKAAASLMTALDGNNQIADMRQMMMLHSGDKEILGITNANERGLFMSSVNGDRTGKIKPNDRPWYQDLKKANAFRFTTAYVSASSQVLVVSATAPYHDKNGKFVGGICENIALDTLKQKVNELKFRGQGNGVIIDSNGKILASTRGIAQMSEAKDMPIVGPLYAQMKQNGKGYLKVEDKDGTELVFCYTTLPSSKWIIGITVPEEFVFEQLHSMRTTYGILIVVGVLLIMTACLFFSNKITSSILALNERAVELSRGNLLLPALEVNSSDELGNLATAFNTMQGNLKKLISSIAATSEQVASSAEELTAGAHQSAEAATDVAQTVVSVADGMDQQVLSVDRVKTNVDAVFADITKMTEKAERVTENSVHTKTVAEQGEQLMQGAVQRMESIEKSVMATADVVKKLGENSQQIGAIIETISSIADQTNLLALNAAIEAARAGEAGRGFSVVAEEVRKLAEQSQQATEEIKDRISHIQTDTDAAVVAMEQGTGEVEKGTQAIREVGQQFGQILNMVGAIEGQIKDINVSVQTVSEGTNNIVVAVEEIDEVSKVTSGHTQTISAAAEEQSASSQEIASASQALADLATELQETTRQFKV